MVRPRTGNPRDVVVSVRLTRREAAQVDAARGYLTRAEWIRAMLLNLRKTPSKP